MNSLILGTSRLALFIYQWAVDPLSDIRNEKGLVQYFQNKKTKRKVGGS